MIFFNSLPKKQMHYPLRSIETPTNGKKRYFGSEIDV